MIGMVQWLGYILTAYLIFRGATGVLDYSARATEAKTGGQKACYAACAVLAMLLIVAAIYLVSGMDDFARSIGAKASHFGGE